MVLTHTVFLFGKIERIDKRSNFHRKAPKNPIPIT